MDKQIVIYIDEWGEVNPYPSSSAEFEASVEAGTAIRVVVFENAFGKLVCKVNDVDVNLLIPMTDQQLADTIRKDEANEDSSG